MEGLAQTGKRKRLGATENWDAYWLSKTPAERIEAVGIINLTIKGEKYAEQELSRVFQITRHPRC
jgi:hypothetical protein